MVFLLNCVCLLAFRWFFYTNHKDIGTLHVTLLSILIQMELAYFCAPLLIKGSYFFILLASLLSLMILILVVKRIKFISLTTYFYQWFCVLDSLKYRYCLLIIFLVFLSPISFCEEMEPVAKSDWFDPHTWDIVCKVTLGCVIVSSVALTGYGLYCFCGSSYGASCYAAVFGTSGTSVVLNVPTKSHSDDLVTKKIIDVSNSVVQLVDPTNSNILHTTSLESWRMVIQDCPYLNPFSSNLSWASSSIDYFIGARSVLGKIDLHFFIDWTLVDVNQIIRYIHPVTGVTWLETTVNTRIEDIDAFNKSIEDLPLEFVVECLRNLSNCNVEYSYRVIEKSGALPAITDSSAQGLMQAIANIFIF